MRPLAQLLVLAAITVLAACGESSSPSLEGPVQIDIQQSLTSQTTSAGTFQLRGALSDDGTTVEELTFGGPLDRSPVPVTFRRTLTGRQGTMILTGSASLSFTSPTSATLAGSWRLEQASGRYASLAASGTLGGNANFAVTPATAALTYSGTLGTP